MGNAQTKGQQKKGGKKYVHWSNADKPSPPGKPQLVPGTPHNQPDVVTIRWEVPLNDGGAPITGYLVEHRRTGSPHWVRATPALVTTTDLTLSGLEPGWRYQFRVCAENAAGMSDPGDLSEPLTVTLQRSAAAAPHFLDELKDTIALENEKAEFLVQYRGTPTPKIAWFKDGFEIFSSRRTKIITENDQSSLVIFQAAFGDEGEIKCTATNRVGHVVTKAKLRLEAPPRIRLPRQYEDGLLFEMDEIIKLKVSVAGRPLPRVTWFHNGEQVVFGGRYEVANTDRYSSVRVGEARRDDRGEYQVKATNRLGEDVVAFLVTVTDRPVPPGKAKVTMTLGRSVTLSWTKPDDDGGCKIGNYIVEYYRLGWNVWLKAATCRQLTTTLGDLIEGSEYKFRVKAENPYGVSDPSGESEVVFIPDPKRGILVAPARGSQPTNEPELTAEQLKEDRKRRRPPIRDSNIPRKEKHLDSSMEYPSSDPDSSDTQARSRPGDFRTPGYKHSPETRQRGHKDRDIPLTVIDYDKDRTGSGKSTPEVKKNGKENIFQIKFDKTKQESMSVPKTKPSRSSRAVREEPDDIDLVPEVYSLSFPVGRSARSMERDSTKSPVLVTRIEDREGRKSPLLMRPRQEERDGRRSPLQMSPREEDDRMEYGSSEMMLVLMPQGKNAQSEADREQHADFCRSFAADNTLGVAPPMSLSSPELGCGEPIAASTLRNAVSSSELLHERAMERLYQEAAAEEVAMSLSRRRSIERKRSYERLGEPNLQARNRARMQTEVDIKPNPVVIEKKRLDKVVEKPKEIAWGGKEKSIGLVREDSEMREGKKGKMIVSLTEEEQEEEDFAKLRARIAQSLEEESKELERELRYRDEESPPEDEEDDASTLSDEDLEEEEVEEEEDEEEEEEEDEEELEENPEEEDESDEDGDMYRPKSTAPKKGDARSPPLRSMDYKRLSDDEEEEPYHPRSMMPRAVQAVPPPPPVPVHREILTVKTLDDKSREYTPPVRYEPKLDLQPKPILKTTSKFEKDDSKTKPKPPSPRVSTPFGSTDKKAKTPIMSKILGKIEAPFKRPRTPAANDSDSNVVVRRLKKESPPKPTAHAQEAERREGDLGLSAAEIARKRRQTKQSSFEEDQEANKIIIDHYSDIVKAYGVPKKTSPTLYLTTEDLKAASEGRVDGRETSLSLSPTMSPTSMSLSPEPDLSEGASFMERLNKSVKSGKTDQTEEVKSKVKSSPTPTLNREVQKYVPPSSPTSSEEVSKRNGTGKHDEGKYNDDYSDEEDESVDEEPWEFTPRQMMARIRRSLTPKRSFRRQRPDRAQIAKQAESRVHNFVTYLTDLAMFLVACWLYLFKDERLAIPVLLLMVYRQMSDAVKSWIPQRWRKK